LLRTRTSALALKEAGRGLVRQPEATLAMVVTVWVPVFALGAVLLAREQVTIVFEWAAAAAGRGPGAGGLLEELLVVLPWLRHLLTALAVLCAAAAVAYARVKLGLVVAARDQEATVAGLLGADPAVFRLAFLAQAGSAGLLGSALALGALLAVVGAGRLALAGWLRQQEAVAVGLRVVGPADVWPLCPLLLGTGLAGVVVAGWLATRRLPG
jgi:cell division protein FtsX